MIPFPNKKYNIIYADPPWSYKDKCHSGKRGAEYKYPTMSISDICNLPVKDITRKDSALFLWVTNPFLPFGSEIMEAWGFDYKTVAFFWIKKNKKSGTNFWGMGNWTRANPEVCLLGIKGKPKRLLASVHSVIESPIEIHSKKPGETRDRIIQLLGDIPRIELFAREKTQGWDAWGNEVN